MKEEKTLKDQVKTDLVEGFNDVMADLHNVLVADLATSKELRLRDELRREASIALLELFRVRMCRYGLEDTSGGIRYDASAEFELDDSEDQDSVYELVMTAEEGVFDMYVTLDGGKHHARATTTTPEAPWSDEFNQAVREVLELVYEYGQNKLLRGVESL